MNSFYDNWSRLVEAVLLREQLRQTALFSSRSPSSSSLGSDYSFTFSSPLHRESLEPTKSPLHNEILAGNSLRADKKSGAKMAQAIKRNKWKGLRIFTVFTTKKDYGEEERGIFQWTRAQRTLHPLKTLETTTPLHEKSSHREMSQDSQLTEKAKIRAEVARFREMYTLKGHLESVMKLKGIDIEKIQLNYTI